MRRCLDHGNPPGEALLARAVEVFNLHYAAVNGEKTRIFEGVLVGLDAWRATGLPLAVLTNKPATFTDPLVARMGLKHHFSIIVSGDSTPFRKPHPEPLRQACARMGRPVNTDFAPRRLTPRHRSGPRRRLHGVLRVLRLSRRRGCKRHRL